MVYSVRVCQAFIVYTRLGGRVKLYSIDPTRVSSTHIINDE